MVKIVIDLPLSYICTSDIDIQPLQARSSIESQQASAFCLSLAVLFVPYSYFLYLHISSLWTLHSKRLLGEMDALDVWITSISLIRLTLIFMVVLVSHTSGLIAIQIFGFIWEIALLLVYFKFAIDNRNHWVLASVITVIFYLVYLGISNHYYLQNINVNFSNNVILVPIFYPLLLIDLTITAVAVYEFMYIEKALAQRSLTHNIIVELKNRRSFIFQTLATCWVSFFMRTYPDIFKPIVGTVLYFVISDLLNMAIIFRCVLHRIVRSHEEISIDDDDTSNYKRSSNLIVVQMQDYPTKK